MNLKKHSIEKICQALLSGGFGPETHSTNTIEWLNNILLGVHLYDKVIKMYSGKVEPTRRLKALRKKYEETGEKVDLIRLNRITIEEFYPDETPKIPKKATGLTETEAIDLQDKIEITLNCGPRKKELLNIRVADINFETGMLRLLGKGGKTRFVPVNKRAREIFERRVKARTGKAGYIFGKGMKPPRDFKRAYKSACKRAGIEDARIHDLRRTFGTRCAMAAVPPKTLQKWMGHSNIETTMKYYVQIPEEFEKEAIERLTDLGKKDRQGDSSLENGGNT